MGEHADDAINDMLQEEFARDEYTSSRMSMQEAYDRSFINEMGTEQEGIQAAWDRNPIHNAESLDRELKDAAKDFEIATLRSELNGKRNTPAPLLNKAAVANLSKPQPTCNSCSAPMTERTGIYGPFFFCANRCPDQKTVSKAYWDSIRR